MTRDHLVRGFLLYLLAVFVIGFTHNAAHSVELVQITEANWDDVVPEGKEVDCILGDWVMRNDHIVAVIAKAVEGRNANMTVRDVRGSVIDLTQRGKQSDQLSAYYPLGAQYKLDGPLRADDSAGDEGIALEGKALKLRFRGPSEDKKSTAEVTYELTDDARWLKITTRVTNIVNEPLESDPADSIRADGEFEFGQDEPLGLFWAYDPYWRQAYGALVLSEPWGFKVGEPGRRRGPPLKLVQGKNETIKLAPAESYEIVRCLFPASDTLDALALAHELRGKPLVDVALSVRDPQGPIDATVALKTAAGADYARGRTDEQGRLSVRLPAGDYKAVVHAQGRGEQTVDLRASRSLVQEVTLPAPGYIVAEITGENGKPTPCKVQFRGRAGTADPNFGPDSAVHGVRNLYYTHDGKFRIPLAPGQYDVIVSHGPEFDAVTTSLAVERGREASLATELKRVVNTSGWISADFHSHSTPSGDNTASQRGRVLNLLAEHVEFAPCTEHNRLTVYDPHLAHFGATRQMLTCPGIELTNTPGSVNHQNAFPMVVHEHIQDNGAPHNDPDPIVQIERLAMWDNGSAKLVQSNHPNIVQMLGDRDLDGSPDAGFEKMFSFMDVIEVHPLDRIFDKPTSLPSARERGSAVFHWLQLMNLGYRVPGVVNTDAHWNFHGSGGLRNYIKSSIDDPAEAKVSDLVHECEHGHIVMTNGPFMEVMAGAEENPQKVTAGDDLDAPGGKLRLRVRVECPNWLSVNRVQVFVSGQPLAKWNYTDRTHAAMFRSGTKVFDEELSLALDSDAHLVVVCAGEGKQLGDVMGPDTGKDMPMAVSNPIFVDVDGGGFKPNGDLLGLPLPLEPGRKPSKGHKHPHD